MSPPGLFVDPYAFARDAREIAESRPVAGFERLAAAVLDPSGTLRFTIGGWRDPDGKSWLRLELTGRPVVQCQRCLEALEWPLAVSSVLLLVREDQALPDEDLDEDAWDCLPVGKRLDLLQVVEDEALLALPFAPRHDECSAPTGTDGGEGTSPFASLARLGRREGRG